MAPARSHGKIRKCPFAIRIRAFAHHNRPFYARNCRLETHNGFPRQDFPPLRATNQRFPRRLTISMADNL